MYDHGGFATGENAGGTCDGMAGVLDLAQDLCVEAGGFASVALNGAGEDEGAVAESSCFGLCSLQSDTAAGDDDVVDVIEEWITGLGCFRDKTVGTLLQMPEHHGGNSLCEVVLFEDGECVGERGGIGRGNARTDNLQD